MALDLKPTLDEEQYPTEETERLVREFEGDVRELMSAIHDVWAFGAWGWSEEDTCDEDFPERKIHRYYVRTGGWSGNETLIGALRECGMFWMCFWAQSRRGGHYIFEVAQDEPMKVVQFRRTPQPEGLEG